MRAIVMVFLLLAASRPAAASPKQLGKAWTAFREGKYAEARKLAAPLVGKKLLAADYALHVAAQSAFMDGDPGAALPLFRKLAKTKTSRFAPVAAWRVADCLFELGKLEEARAAYQGLLGKSGGDAGVALHRIGLAHEAAGDKGKALASWRRLATQHPAHPLADDALARLDAAGAGLTIKERIARAAEMTGDRDWNRALAELEEIPTQDQPADIVRERNFWLGMTLFNMRRQYARAGDLLVGVHAEMGGRAAEALFKGARAYSRADRDDDAITHYAQVVAKYPRTPQAAEAQFLIGWLEFNRGDYRKAIPGLQATLDEYGSSKWADDARWYLAFSLYLLGEHAEALPHLERLSRAGGELEGGKARYWRARSLAALGKKDEANAALRELVGEHPFSWYAQLARARLAEQKIEVGPFGDRDVDKAEAPPLADPGDKDVKKLAATPLIKLADELISAGMTVEAGWELQRAEQSFIKKHGRAKALPILLDRYRRAGNFNRPWMLAVVYGGRAFDLPPKGTAKKWWEHSYPLAYRQHVEKWRDLGKNPEYYLYTIMRKESGFNPHDVSYADALGLLQMIPPTTKRVAPILGLEYTDDLLYDPELNIRVGSWYIGSLLQKFKMQVPIGAGSFNSGPRPVMKWLDKFGDRPMDEFVELVAYTQTREYMKKVADIYARYLYLYEGEDHQQPLKVDREYLKNALTY